MRWKMCPSCGTKMQLSINEENLHIFKCYICKQSYIDLDGDLLTITKKKIDKKPIDKFLDELLNLIEGESDEE